MITIKKYSRIITIFIFIHLIFISYLNTYALQKKHENPQVIAKLDQNRLDDLNYLYSIIKDASKNQIMEIVDIIKSKTIDKSGLVINHNTVGSLVFIKFVEDIDFSTSFAAEALRSINDPIFIQRLVEILYSLDEPNIINTEILKILGKKSVDPLLDKISEEANKYIDPENKTITSKDKQNWSTSTRIAAIIIIDIGEEAVPKLIEHLKKEDRKQYVSLYLLGHIGRAAVPSLIKSLISKEIPYYKIFPLLMFIGSPAKPAIPYLIEYIEQFSSEDFENTFLKAYTASKTLQEITGNNFGVLDLEKWPKTPAGYDSAWQSFVMSQVRIRLWWQQNKEDYPKIELSSDTLLKEEKRKVTYNTAVVEFTERGDIGIKDAGNIIAEWMSIALKKTNVFKIYDRLSLDKLIKEYGIGQSGLIDEYSIARVGKMIGAQVIITGSIIKFSNIISVTVKLIDTETAELIDAADFKTFDVNTIPSKIDILAQQLASE